MRRWAEKDEGGRVGRSWRTLRVLKVRLRDCGEDRSVGGSQLPQIPLYIDVIHIGQIYQ